MKLAFLTISLCCVGVINPSWGRSSLTDLQGTLLKSRHEAGYRPPEISHQKAPTFESNSKQGGYRSPTSHAEDVPDISDDPWVFTSTQLPMDGSSINFKRMPSVGNGHLATTIHSDAVFVNGLYNGKMGESYRARIKAEHAALMTISQETDTRTHSLDTKRGMYEEIVTTTSATINHTIYAHQKYTRVLVTEVTLNRRNGNNVITMFIDVSRSGSESDDLQMSSNDTYNAQGCADASISCRHLVFNTKEGETDTNGTRPVHVYHTQWPNATTLPGGDQTISWVMYLSVDTVESIAKDDFDKAMAERDTKQLGKLHTDEWQKIWDGGRIEVTGDLRLQKIIHGSFYYLYSNLPVVSITQNTPNNDNSPFGGLSPGSLAKGTKGIDYYGHVFWDMETWMYPPILMFRPDLAREMLSYRIMRMDPAKYRAYGGGYMGTRFPWESAYTGEEVTPDICVECRENQQHITGDIAFAARQYIMATNDTDWLKGPQYRDVTGYDFIWEMARFWFSRPIFNSTKDKYEIEKVMPPDEHHKEVNNSIYTNVMANLAVSFARYAACLADKNPEEEVGDRWLRVVENLYFTYNFDRRYHEEFENFQHMWDNGELFENGTKQADVVLLGYPIMWDMPPDVRRNDLDIYERLTYEAGPAMTWGMHSIGWLELGELQRAADMFKKSYSPYMREPFKIWTESSTGDGAVNFITGMGGFLQAVLFGYGGLRLKLHELDFYKPELPQNVTNMKFLNLDYLGHKLDIQISETQVNVTDNINAPANDRLKLKYGEIEHELTEGITRSFDRQPFKIFHPKEIMCDRPRDFIYNDYGVSSGVQTSLSWFLLQLSCIVVKYFDCA